jgi:dienelactone hydrolase
MNAVTRLLFRSLLLGFACGCAAVLCSPALAHAEHGQFDRTTPDERDEAYLFTPAGFRQAGKPATVHGADAARLNVVIVDGATGSPTPCRVNVVGSNGNYYQPSDNPLRSYSLTGNWPDTLAGNRPGKAPIRYFGHFFYTRGSFSVEVPPGATRIEVWKGFEYGVEMLSTHAVASATQDVQIKLSKTVSMPELGWHSGDPHLHFTRASDADDDTIFDLLAAEDIRQGMILCYNDNTSDYQGLMPELATPQLRGLGAKSVRRRGDYRIISGQEYRNGVLGHLNLFLRDRLYLDGARLDPNNGPLFAAIGEETRQQGGYAFHAHGGYGLEIWADLVQGATTGVELLQFGIYRGIGLDGWYHALNAGFRFPAIAASDYPACRKLGDCRTYAHVEGEPTFEAWLKAAAAGRSFITSGPLILLEVDGHRAGDTIEVNDADAQPHRVRAQVRVRSDTAAVTNVHLVVNGRVVRELQVPRDVGTGQWLELNETVELKESGWIAARAFSTAPTGAADAEAHTNPVYVSVGGRPPYQAADVDWLVARLDEQILDHTARQVPEKQKAIDYFRHSRDILLELKGRHAARTQPAARPDGSELQMALERPLLPAGTPLGELRAFIEPRIVSPPKFESQLKWQQEAAKIRCEMLDKIIFRGPAQAWRQAKTGVDWLDTVPGGPGYRLRKFRYEALPGMWIPGVAYLPERIQQSVPLVLSLNGHTKEGKATDYKQLLSINLAKRGMVVLDLEWLGMGQLATPGFSHYRMNQLELCGAGGLAPFYLSLTRALDLGLSLENVDRNRVLVTGLSGGGWQTILLSALDERVTLANPVAGYGGFRTNILFDDMGDSEQSPTDMATVADYTHLTALRAPRPTLLTYNAGDDCCFKSGHALGPLLEAARPAFALSGAADRLRWHVNYAPGTHNFDEENREQLYAMIGDFFYAGDSKFIRDEIPSRAELKTAAELHVPLPAENVDFARLAKSLLTDLPDTWATFSDRPAAERWQHAKRERLMSVLKIPRYEVSESQRTTSRIEGYQLAAQLLRCGGQWTVPCLEVMASDAPAQKTALLVVDAGKRSALDEVRRLVAAGYRVLVVDVLSLGESEVVAQDPAYLYPLFLSAVGERPLGLQAAQLAGIARFVRERRPDEPVTVIAVGPRASMAALVAAAIEPTAIQGAELMGALKNLRQLIDEDKTVEEFPELFAFGLLAEFDVPQLVALSDLSAGRSIVFRESK